MQIEVRIMPRETLTWQHFKTTTPSGSIALDGMVSGGPGSDLSSLHFNFDHHSSVVREATMSTAMQVFFAVKGGIFEAFKMRKLDTAYVYINDIDQDTSLAVWLLRNFKLFEGTQSIPCINRLLALTDRLDITGGAFPMNLDDELVELHNWVFEPYTNLRKSGSLATSTREILNDNLEAVLRSTQVKVHSVVIGSGYSNPSIWLMTSCNSSVALRSLPARVFSSFLKRETYSGPFSFCLSIGL